MTTFEDIPRDSPIHNLLETYDTGHGSFITHVDHSPVQIKRIAFIPTFLLHLFVAGLLYWRIKSISSYYYIWSAFFGDLLPRSDAPDIAWYWTMFHCTVDFWLLKTGGRMLHKFVSGHLFLRLRWGFRDAEIIFRKPTGGMRSSLNGLAQSEFDTAWTNHLYRAIDIRFLKENTGYNTRSTFWVLEYQATTRAQQLVSSGTLSIHDFDLRVFKKEGDRWTVWQVWKVHDPGYNVAILKEVKQTLDDRGRTDVWDKFIAYSQANSINPDGTVKVSTHQSTQGLLAFFKQEGIDMEELWQNAHNVVEERRNRTGAW